MPKTAIADARSLLSELETWVRLETPTTDAARVNALMNLAEGELALTPASSTFSGANSRRASP
jgi:glutamate carboxypeptidase